MDTFLKLWPAEKKNYNKLLPLRICVWRKVYLCSMLKPFAMMADLFILIHYLPCRLIESAFVGFFLLVFLLSSDPLVTVATEKTV